MQYARFSGSDDPFAYTPRLPMLLLLIAILLVVNALFVLAEMALVSSRRARLESRAKRGDRRALSALQLLDRPNTFLSTTQIGITLISILMGAFGEAAIADRLVEHLRQAVPSPDGSPPTLGARALGMVAQYARPIALGATVLLLTYVTLVISELVPKRIGQSRPEAIASALAPSMRLLSRLAAPLVWLLSVSTELVLKLVPIRARPEHEATEEEVRTLVASGARAGVFHEAEQEMIERLFRLSDQKITAVMVPRPDVDFLREHDTVERVRVVLATTSHSHYPVCVSNLDDLIGVVHVKDLVRHGIISDNINLRDLAAKPVFVPESTPALTVFDRFRSTGNHIAFVIDEYGAIIGLVTLTDLLEAIVGGWSGNADPRGAPQGTAGAAARGNAAEDDPLIVRRPDGSYLLDGMLPVSDLKELMGVAVLPHEDDASFETLGGFVLTFLGRIPATGDFFEHQPGPGPHADTAPRRFSFEIVDMDRTRVDKVLLSIQQDPSGEGAAGEGV